MFYIGYGGLDKLPNVFIPIIYFGGIFVWVFVVCAKAEPRIRKLTLKSIISAWIPIIFMMILQFPEHPDQALLFIGCPIVIWLMKIPGEFLVREISRKS